MECLGCGMLGTWDVRDVWDVGCGMLIHKMPKLGAKHARYQKLANFMSKKDIYVNRLQSVTFGM